MSLDTPGSYLLLLAVEEPCDIRAGKSRNIRFEPGMYCYVGSALGPGGLRARLSRHASRSKRKHWHIDYLLPYARITGALVVESTDRTECKLAAWVGELADSCIPGFGSTDCRCEGHLFWIEGDSSESRLIDNAVASLGARHVPVEEFHRNRQGKDGR